jgi:hypothetical protein
VESLLAATAVFDAGLCEPESAVSEPDVLGSRRRESLLAATAVFDVGLCEPESAVSEPNVLGSRRRESLLAATAVFDAGLCEPESAVSEPDALGSRRRESLLAATAVFDVGLCEPESAVSEPDALGSRRRESLLAATAVFDAGLCELESAVSEPDAAGSTGGAPAIAGAAKFDPDSLSFGGSILASDRRLLRISFRLPCGSPPVCCSISEVRSVSSVRSFFFRWWSPPAFPPDSLGRTSFQSPLEFSAASLHGFGVEACNPGHFSHAPPAEDRRKHCRYPPTMFLIQLIANQFEIRFPSLRLIRSS